MSYVILVRSPDMLFGEKSALFVHIKWPNLVRVVASKAIGSQPVGGRFGRPDSKLLRCCALIRIMLNELFIA